MASPETGSVASHNAPFHAWLRTQFSTLDEAKAWVHRWFNEWDQVIPASVSAEWGSGPGWSMRAMAAHVSAALEAREYDWNGLTWYLDTKHGPELYYAMCVEPKAKP